MLTSSRAQRIDRVADLIVFWGVAGLATWSLGFRAFAALGAGATALGWFASRLLRQYDEDNGRGFFGDLALTGVMLAAIVVPVWIGSALLGHADVGWTFALVVAPAVIVLRVQIVELHRRRVPTEDAVLVVGAGPLARLTGKEIADGDRRVIGHLRFDDESADPHLHAPVLGAASELEEIFKDHVVDEVYLSPSRADEAAAVQAAIATCERFGIPFALPVCSYRLTRAKPIGHVASEDGYAHFSNAPSKPVQVWIKRAFDIAASGAALILLSPVLALTALAVKVTSRGPVLFRQQRVGLHGRTFDMLKFRSMVADAEALRARLLAHNEQSGPVFKMKRDPRITGVGRVIRKFSIDELPQLVNVLRGDMSIVGPRPPLASEVAKYEAWQRRRLSVRPGLTCVWQVSGRNEIGFRDWMLLDMRYIDHWSLKQDFELILQTVPVVLTGKGAS